jgi:hypothetical protein
MRRRLLIAVLAFGTVAGYASGFAHLRGWRHCGHERFGQERSRCERGHRPEGARPQENSQPPAGP